MPRVQLHTFDNIKELVQDIDDVFLNETHVDPEKNKENHYSDWRTLDIIAKTDVIKQVYSLIIKKNNIVRTNGKYYTFDEDCSERVEEVFNKYDVLHIIIDDSGEVYLETLDHYILFSNEIDIPCRRFAFIQQGLDGKYILAAEQHGIPTLWFNVTP